MLEIDYSLVPMSPEDEQFVRDEVARRVQQGEIPAPDRSLNGRLVLLNPDLVQTLHQVPDELRPRLRRIMMPAQEGSTHLPAERIYQHIIESDERLYLIVIELQSEFRAFSSFLDYLPRLRMQYPELAVYLSGTIPDLRAKLQQVLAEGGATLVLEYNGGERVVEIHSAEAFERMITTQQQVVTYSLPFFTDIRLRLDRSGKPIGFNLLTLRKLQSVFGHGPAEEVEVGKGRRERMIVVDLPLPLIHDFRFRQDRGLDFLGVVIGGQVIQSRHFGDERLEFRWVPMHAVEKFLRRSPTGGQEEIDMSKVGKLRINTLTGEVSFLMKEIEEKVAVEQASAIYFRKARRADQERGGNGKGGDGEEEQEVFFEHFIQPSSHSAHQDPMQEAVRAHFYHKLIGEAVEHTRKRENYAQRLRAAAVGPLAGQTLKLLRRFGLERLIDPESFYYLCDTPEEVPYYRNTAQRYEQHFSNLVETMREVAVGQPSDRVRIADIAYNMPLSTEWVDAGLASLDKVTTQELEAVYHEMKLLSDFIAHEFRRNFDIDQQDLTFFAKMQTCSEASLLAKWLAEFKRGAYGQPMPQDQYPDVLFFATDEDKKENDSLYHFPSLACSELFNKPIAKGLFRGFDYDFSVFLEEQMALAVHFAREEGVLNPTAQDFADYFTAKIEEQHEQQRELHTMLEAIDDESSPIYQQMLKQEEQAYHERYEQFLTDRKRVEAELGETNQRVEALVGSLKGQLDLGEYGEADFFRDTPGHPELLEQRLLGAASRTQVRLNELLQEVFNGLLREIDTWRGKLEAFVAALRRYLQHNQAWQNAHEARQTATLREQWQGQVRGRMEQLRRMQAIERDQHTRRVQTQLRNYQGELTQINARLSEQLLKNQRAANTLHAYVQSADGRLASLRELEPGGAAEKVMAQSEALRKLLNNIATNAEALAGRVEAMQEGLDKVRVRKQRHLQQLYQLRAEMAVIRAVEDRTEPVLPKVQAPGGKLPTEEDVQRLQHTWQSHGEALAQAREPLNGGGEGIQAAIQAVRGQALEFRRFDTRHDRLVKLMTRKVRLREAAQSLAERQTLMDEELADLPQRVRQLFMPARKQLLMDVFIPESEHTAAHFGKAQAFVTELLGLPTESLQARYLDHAIFRRFYSRQFMRGGAYAADPNSDMHYPTRNVAPALRLLLRALTHNFQRHRLAGAERVQLPTLSNQGPKEILATIRNMASVAGRGQFDYLVLPPTMPLKDGLALLHEKDGLYEGVPRLVLIFITKFDPQLLRHDAAMRDSYFRALKHNVVLNIDGHVVVDNPRSIGMRLLQETLGCAIDVSDAEEPPEVASAAE